MWNSRQLAFPEASLQAGQLASKPGQFERKRAPRNTQGHSANQTYLDTKPLLRAYVSLGALFSQLFFCPVVVPLCGLTSLWSKGGPHFDLAYSL